jgi:hypothetical protein
MTSHTNQVIMGATRNQLAKYSPLKCLVLSTIPKQMQKRATLLLQGRAQAEGTHSARELVLALLTRD